MDTHESRRTYAEGRFSAPQTAVWGLALALVFGLAFAGCDEGSSMGREDSLVDPRNHPDDYGIVDDGNKDPANFEIYGTVLTKYNGGQSGNVKVIIPSGVTTISDLAFSQCYDLTSVTIPDSVTTIGNSAFHYCRSLSSVSIGSGVITIEKHAFEYCTALASVTIPDSVTTIGAMAFYDSTGLTSVTIGSGVTEIEGQAFGRCNALTAFNVAAGNVTYKDIGGVLCGDGGTLLIRYPAGKTDASYTIPSGVTTIGNSAFFGCSALTSVTIPNSVQTIGSGAFGGCSGLTSVTIPDGVTTIGENAFYGCKALTEFNVAIGNATYKAIDGVLYGDGGTSLVRYPAGNSLIGCLIPEGVTKIEYRAFEDCINLYWISIPASLSSVGNSAFSGCSNLEKIIVDEGNTYYAGYGFLYGKTYGSYPTKSPQSLSIALPDLRGNMALSTGMMLK